MWRHLIPRADAGDWSGSGLTASPYRDEPYTPIEQSFRKAFGQSTTRPAQDDVEGYVLCVQWLGIIVEIAIGRVR